MTIALKTEWIIYSDNVDINEEVTALERYCVGNVRIFKGDFDSDSDSIMKMTTKLEFEVFADTDMDDFWDLVEGVVDYESEE